MLVVEHEHEYSLRQDPDVLSHKIIAYVRERGELKLFRQLAALIVSRRLRQELQERRRMLGYTVHLDELVIIGVKDRGKASEPVEKLVSRRIRILPRKGIKQQKLKCVYLIEPVEPALQESAFESLSVSLRHFTVSLSFIVVSAAILLPS